ncbi:hypothetical protein UK23_32775 [Lentzea aerocolonigenes]|uniref:Uncharacterized protein n=1 Tax=Lentzea aerocolonigenes TaxID=68170 RepID=A0A0F0GNN4_LENAE|nr:hypothetical protein UK23_32775 [Lentzea aerocolonigenes]
MIRRVSVAPAPVRHLRALIRDDANVRRGLRDAESALYDHDTTDRLRELLDSLLETIYSLAQNNELWERLEDAAERPITREELDELNCLVWTALPVLLEAFGYRCPPPPPASKLVDDTQVSLGAALTAGDDRRELVRQARWYFLTFTMRVRKQVDFAPLGIRSAVVRQASREASSVAGTLVPIIAGGAAEVVTEAGLTAVGLPAPVAKVAGKVSEHGIKLAAEALIGWMKRRQPEPSSPEPPQAVNPVRVHLGAIATEHGRLTSIVDVAMDPGSYGESQRDVAAYRAAARDLGRHVRRLRELIVDGGLDHPSVMDALADLDEAFVLVFDAASRFRRCPAMAADGVVQLQVAFDRTLAEVHRAEEGGRDQVGL